MFGSGTLSVMATMSLVDNFTGPLRSVTSSMEATQGAANRLSNRMGNLAKSMLPVATAAAAVVGALGTAALSTIPTEKALGELASVGITNFEALEASATQMSNRFSGVTKVGFLTAAYDIKSGIASLTDEGVAKFTELATLTAKATKATEAEMTSLFATGYGIYKDFYGQMSDFEFGEMFSGAIAAAVQGFKTTGPQMQQAISGLGAAATNANVPLQEQIAILGMLQQVTPGGEAATTYGAFIESAAGAGKKLGLEFLDANNQLRPMVDIIGELRNKFGPTLDAVEKMQLKDAFGTKEAIELIDFFYGKTNNLGEGITFIASAMGQGASFTEAMAQKMNQGLGPSLQRLWQQFGNLGEIVGGVFAPVVSLAAEGLSKVVLLLQEAAASPVGKAIIGIAGAAALAVLGFTAWAAASWAVASAMPMLTAALAPLAGVIASISWPIWLIIAAVGALYLAWRTNFGGMANTVARWWTNIQLVYQGVVAVFGSLQDGTGVIRGELARDIKAAGLVGVVTTVARVAYRIREYWLGATGAISAAWNQAMVILGPALDALVDMFGALGEIVGMVTSALLGAGAATDASSWRILGEVVGTILGGAFKSLAFSIRLALMPLQGLAALLRFAIDIIQGVDLSEAGRKLITTWWEGIKSNAGWLYDNFRELLGPLGRMLPHSDAQEGPLSTLTASGAAIPDTLGSGVQAAAPRLAATVAGALAGMSLAVAPVQVEAAHADFLASPPSPYIETSRETHSSSGRSSGSRQTSVSGRHITINIQNLNLPSVKDSDSFIEQLTRIVEAHDG